MAFKIFHRPKPRQFHYNPLYYNEQKEKIEQLKQQMAGNTAGEYKKYEFKSQLQSKWRRESRRNSQTSNIRLVLIILALLLITYLMFK